MVVAYNPREKVERCGEVKGKKGACGEWKSTAIEKTVDVGDVSEMTGGSQECGMVHGTIELHLHTVFF